MTGPEEKWPLAQAWAWIDALAAPGRIERVRTEAGAVGRVLAQDILLPADRPEHDLALADGFAVRSADTVGAGGYNPLSLMLVPPGPSLPAGAAMPCNAGEPPPEGADAILPLEAAEARGRSLEIAGPVAPGTGLARRGQTARCGEHVLAAGRRLSACDVALAGLLGLDGLVVRAHPVVALIVAGPKSSAREAVAEPLTALIRRDGGEARPLLVGMPLAPALQACGEVEAVLLAGRSAWGADDAAAQALVRAGGSLEQHGLAMTLGESCGLGRLGRAPLLLLPGDPLAALVSYELLAGRLIRHLAGLPAALPFPRRQLVLGRKIASRIGTTEWIPLAIHGGRAEPLAVPPADGLLALARADGFLVVPPGCEGYRDGETVEAFLTTDAASEKDAP